MLETGISRRTMGVSAAGFAAGVLAACGGGAEAQSQGGSTTSRPTIVMVEGAWHWAGCFIKVANLLTQMGFPVVLPDLKSHGYSTATYDQVTGMADYVAPVGAVLEAATSPVILLGHSMGGVSITHLGEAYPSKIRKLVYLTAYMTPNGRSANDYIFSPAYMNDPNAAEVFQVLGGSADGKGVMLDKTRPALVRAAFYGDCSDRDVSIAVANTLATTSNVPYGYVPATTAARYGSIPRVYIECTADHAIPIAQQRQMQADVPGATVMTLNTSHSPFFSQPQALADMIARASAS